MVVVAVHEIGHGQVVGFDAAADRLDAIEQRRRLARVVADERVDAPTVEACAQRGHDLLAPWPALADRTAARAFVGFDHLRDEGVVERIVDQVAREARLHVPQPVVDPSVSHDLGGRKARVPSASDAAGALLELGGRVVRVGPPLQNSRFAAEHDVRRAELAAGTRSLVVDVATGGAQQRRHACGIHVRPVRRDGGR